MTPVRIGATVSGSAALAFILLRTRFPWAEPGAWVLAFTVSLIVAFYGASVVKSVLLVRAGRSVLRGPVLLLALLSALPAYSHVRQARDARRFMATADSAKAEVIRTFLRGGPRVVVSFHVGPTAIQVMSPGRVDSLSSFRVGDSLWVFFPPASPDSAHLGHPSADAANTRDRLLWLWLGGGPLLVAYGSRTVYFLRPSTYSVPRSTA